MSDEAEAMPDLWAVEAAGTESPPPRPDEVAAATGHQEDYVEAVAAKALAEAIWRNGLAAN